MAELTWKIETSLTTPDYVTIKNNGGTSSTGYLSTPSNTTEGANLITTSVVNDNSKWKLERYTGGAIDGADLVNFKSSFIAGESNTLKDYTYSSIISISSHLHRWEDFFAQNKAIASP